MKVQLDAPPPEEGYFDEASKALAVTDTYSDSLKCPDRIKCGGRMRPTERDKTTPAAPLEATYFVCPECGKSKKAVTGPGFDISA